MSSWILESMEKLVVFNTFTKINSGMALVLLALVYKPKMCGLNILPIIKLSTLIITVLKIPVTKMLELYFHSFLKDVILKNPSGLQVDEAQRNKLTNNACDKV